MGWRAGEAPTIRPALRVALKHGRPQRGGERRVAHPHAGGHQPAFSVIMQRLCHAIILRPFCSPNDRHQSNGSTTILLSMNTRYGFSEGRAPVLGGLSGLEPRSQVVQPCAARDAGPGTCPATLPLQVRPGQWGPS